MVEIVFQMFDKEHMSFSVENENNANDEFDSMISTIDRTHWSTTETLNVHDERHYNLNCEHFTAYFLMRYI